MNPARLHFTGDDAADELLAREPLALLIGMVLDQQVPVPVAFAGPLKLKRRLGTLDARELARLEPAKVEAAFREKPAVHRFPGSMATRVQELCAIVSDEYGGRAERIWTEASGTDDLRERLDALPGFGELKVMTLASILARRFGVAAAEPLVPDKPVLGDVDSLEALDRYQAWKRENRAKQRA